MFIVGLGYVRSVLAFCFFGVWPFFGVWCWFRLFGVWRLL